MSHAQMAYRCPSAGLVRPAVLRRHRFTIAEHGFGTVVPEATAEVYGVLWMVTAEDEQALDRYEGVGEGLYRRERRRVHVTLGGATGSSDPVDALVYVSARAEPGRPRRGYLAQVIAGAEAHALPDGYVAELRRWQSLETGSR